MEGTIKDGVIKWKVPTGNVSFEGKLVGNELVGTSKGSYWQGDWSGQFRLTMADHLPAAELPARVPPVGPSREASFVVGGGWSVEGGELIKEGLGDGWVLFGDIDWTDYDMNFQVLKRAAPTV